MSAAEKLEALGPDLDSVLDELIAWVNTDNVGCIEVEQRGEQMRLRLRNALPQIGAVVEAAQVIRNFWQRPGGTPEEAALADALAALEEALT